MTNCNFPVMSATDSLNESIPCVLLIMSDKGYSEYLIKALSKGFHFLVLEDSDAIIDTCHREEPDAIIIDETVHGVYGSELCLQIKDEPTLTSIPVALLYRYYDEESYLSYLGCQANCMLQRSMDITKFRVDLHILINSYQAIMEWIIKSPSYMLYRRKEGDKRKKINEDDRKFLEKVDEFWNEKFSSEDEYDPKAFYTYMEMGQSTFYGKMKRITGSTLLEYRNFLRMQKASEYLISDDWTVSEIANKLGYCDCAYFRAKFKEKYHISPTDYRKKYQKK